MRLAGFPWRKAAYSLLLGAILFLTILPAFGWAWHRVLPEHIHIYFGAPHSDDAEDELALVASSPANETDICLDCAGTQIQPGLVHLPGFMGAQILAMAVSIAALFWMQMPPAFSAHLVPFSCLYQSPLLAPLDPPPTVN